MLLDRLGVTDMSRMNQSAAWETGVIYGHHLNHSSMLFHLSVEFYRNSVSDRKMKKAKVKPTALPDQR